MATATVYHQTNRNHMFFELEANEVNMADFKNVAIVIVDGYMSEAEALDYAYITTNSIDCAWYASDNPNVISTECNCRSTSCGDIIRVNGKHFMVADIGFKELSI